MVALSLSFPLTQATLQSLERSPFHDLRVCFPNFFTSRINPRIMTMGNRVANSNPVFRLPPTASAIPPTMAGLTVAPKSPAKARNANIAVPPLGHFCEEILIVPGHIIPTDNPQSAQPTRAIIEMGDSAANR